MGKRKRDSRNDTDPPLNSSGAKKFSDNSQRPADPQSTTQDGNIHIQIITGSYNRVLHGFTARVDLSNLELPKEDESQDVVKFTDTFLFNAHASAIRCLALSPVGPGDAAKIILASGGTDEKVNLYTISANAPSASSQKEAASLPSLGSVAKLQDPKNREIGSLLHHSSTVTKLSFASRSKLISASEDNTLAVSRCRDWSVLTILKAPIPQAHGRPSGDTAAPGKTPAGVNDFDIDPSMKIMISTGRGERCMRLWNLVTGKRAGVLNFGKELLQTIGEAKFHAGEGRKVLFEPGGEGFVIGFERAAVMFNMQSEVHGLAIPRPQTKLHQLKFLSDGNSSVLAASTEDGRIVLYDTVHSKPKTNGNTNGVDKAKFQELATLAQIGGAAAGVANRIKDFEILPLDSKPGHFLIVTAGSDGSTRIWHLELSDVLAKDSSAATNSDSKDAVTNGSGAKAGLELAPRQVGRLIGRFDTVDRITCMKAFVMLPPAEGKIEDEVQDAVTSDSGEEEFEGFD